MKRIISLLLIISMVFSLSSCFSFKNRLEEKKEEVVDPAIEELKKQVEELKEILKEKEEEIKDKVEDFSIDGFLNETYIADMFARNFDDMEAFDLFFEQGLTVYYNSVKSDGIGGYLILAVDNREKIPVLIEAFDISADGISYPGSYLSKIPADTNRPLIIFFPSTEFVKNAGKEMDKISFILSVLYAQNDEFIYESQLLEIY